MKNKLTDLVKKSCSTVKDTTKNIGRYALITAPAWLPFLANESVHAEGPAQRETMQEAESPDFFTDGFDLLAKVQAVGAEDYNALNASAKISSRPLGFFAYNTRGTQDTESLGKVDFNEKGYQVSGYHIFECDWGKINTSLKLGQGTTDFDNYPIDNVEVDKWGLGAKFIGNDWKGYASYNQGDGEFEYGGDKDYKESALTLGFKHFFNDFYGGIDFDQLKTDHESIGDSRKDIISVYGGYLGEDYDLLVGIYNENEKGFDEKTENHLGLEVRFTKIFNNHWGIGLEGFYQDEEGIGGRFKALYRRKF
ncbi:hypothetical protein GF361_03360 [Candidatus Woesearchaeota archaeon]|nr:hypothetical protein [Candidatus Woesearchaeota archaeon]